MKTLGMIALTFIVMVLGFICLSFWLKKLTNIEFPNISPTVSIITNIVMIVIMLFTIVWNNRSLQESTNKTIDTFKKEVSKQIDSYKEASVSHISAIKKSTKEYIDTVEKFDFDSKRALLDSLSLECERNLGIIIENLNNKEEYTKDIEEIRKDKNPPTRPINQFCFEVYQANLNNATISDSELLKKILQAYSILKIYQKRINLVTLPGVSQEDKRNAMLININQMEQFV